MAKLTDEERRKAAHEAVDAVADAVGPAAKKARNAANDTAKRVSSAIKPGIVLQYGGKETNTAAYYVINDDYVGKLDL